MLIRLAWGYDAVHSGGRHNLNCVGAEKMVQWHALRPNTVPKVNVCKARLRSPNAMQALKNKVGM
jgi:hypothetical protein